MYELLCVKIYRFELRYVGILKIRNVYFKLIFNDFILFVILFFD